MKAGEIELGVAANVDVEWDRLDRWPIFEEGFVMLAPPDWPRSPISASALVNAAVIARPYCETPDAAIPSTGSQHRHEGSNDEDAARLARCGMGVAITPESTGRRLAETVIEIEDLALTRLVRVYGVAGRERSVAANSLLKLFRAADWSATIH